MNYVTTKEYFLHFAYVVAILWELNVVADSLAFCAQEMRHSTDFMISNVKLRFSEFTKNLTKLPFSKNCKTVIFLYSVGTICVKN